MIETRKNDFLLKEATKEDVDLIYNMIYDLAVHEKAEDQVKATNEKILENIFERRLADVLIAFYKNEVIGFCVYCPVFSTFEANSYLYIDDLYIKPEFRHQGFGSEILYQMAKLCIELEYAYVGWFCYNDNEGALSFYNNTLKATPYPELLRFKWHREAMDVFMK